MYGKIYVPLDNSPHSNACMDFSVALARSTGARLVGAHVYAAGMHDRRFRQMEFTLPEKYRDEPELERQRHIHGSLIGMGLRLISDSYLEMMEKRCAREGLPFAKKTSDGRNFRELVRDIRRGEYDLVVMGSQGQGAVKESLVGSVTQRVVRRIEVDTLVVKNLQPWAEQLEARAPIVVALDGSPQSFHALKVGLFLAGQYNKTLQAVAVYDPYFHYSIFHRIAGVLSDEAAGVFKFKQQEQLHEEVIDTGLAKIYQAHLEVGKRLAAAAGVEMQTHLLPGKPFEKILQHLRHHNAWLLVCGRIGVHSEAGMDIGSNAENLLRLAPCHVLLASGRFTPPIDLEAEESVHWTEEALGRMEKVPPFVQGVARQAILRWALERGHSVISSAVIDEALGGMLSPETAAARGAPGGEERGASAAPSPSESGEAGGAGTMEWTAAAVERLRRVPAGFMRGLTRQRLEAFARRRGLDTVTPELVEEKYAAWAAGSKAQSPALRWEEAARARLERIPEFVRGMVMLEAERCAREMGRDRVTDEVLDQAKSAWEKSGAFHSERHPELYASESAGGEGPEEGRRAPASSKCPFAAAGRRAAAAPETRPSSLEWTAAAEERLQRAPPFVRQIARQSIERFAAERGRRIITEEVVEEAQRQSGG